MFKWNWSRATAPPTLLKGPQIHERLRDESCFSPGLARLKQDSKMANIGVVGLFTAAMRRAASSETSARRRWAMRWLALPLMAWAGLATASEWPA